MTATTTKPLTANQQKVYDFFSPGCAFTRADLVKMTRMQGATLTYPLMSLIKRGLVIEQAAETLKDDITYHMAEAEAMPEAAMIEDSPEVEDAPRTKKARTSVAVPLDYAGAATVKTTQDYIAAITEIARPTSDTAAAKQYPTTGAYRIEGRAKKSGVGNLYVGVWADTGATMRWAMSGKNGTYTLRIQADDEAAAERWAARQFPTATKEVAG